MKEVAFAFIRFAVLLAILPASIALAAAPQQAPAAQNPAMIDTCNYPNDRAARAAWIARNGSAPVSAIASGDRKVLRFRCNFKGTQLIRAYYDRLVKLDLSGSQGLQFRIYCPNPSPVSKFNFYLHSGRGWYAGTFTVRDPSVWNTVVIDKSAMQKEDSPGGWGDIDMIRIAAWRGEKANTEFHIADLGYWGKDAQIVIIRGDSYAKRFPSEAKSIAAATEATANHFREIGGSYCILSDLDVTDRLMEGRKLAVFPNNPEIADGAAGVLRRFITSGGKMLTFYVIPPPLRTLADITTGKHMRQACPGNFASLRSPVPEIAGFPEIVEQASWNIFQARPVTGRSKTAAWWYSDSGENTGEPAVIVSRNCIHMTHVLLPDDPARKQAMLLSMAGHFVPALWQKAASAAMEQSGVFGGYGSAAQAEQSLRSAAGTNTEVLAIIRKAVDLRSEAGRLFDAGKFADAFLAAGNAHRQLITAHCMIQTPLKDEYRAFWCHSAFGVAGMSWDQSIRILAENGFTDILPNMGWAGTAYYKSEVLPMARETATKGDQLAQCLAACRKYGIKCHVWKICWNMSGQATPEFAAGMKAKGRTQVGFDGKPEDQWLCPSHPDNQRLEIDALLELADKYDVDGVHLDYIRYPGADSCFCNGCRSRFEDSIGRRVRRWPADVRTDRALNKEWMSFRRNNISRVVASASAGVRRIKPGIMVSAAVFSDWRSGSEDVGQDWKLWCERGHLDFVCPMDYTPDGREFETMVARQLPWAGQARCYPGIGLSLWPPASRMIGLIDQITTTRRLKTGGFTIFNYGSSEANDVVPMCGKGITGKQ